MEHMSDRRISDKGWLGGLLDHGSPLDYNMFKMPQNRLHESLMKLSWVRLSFSPPCRPCCSLGGNVLGDGEGMHCLCHRYFLAALRYIQTISVRSRKCRGGRRNSSSSPASVYSCRHRGKLVRFLTWGGFVYRWLSGLGTNEPPV